MKLPPDFEFHEDVRLLIYRPRGLIDEPAVNKIINVLEDLEAAPGAFQSILRYSETMKLSLTSNTLFKFLFVGGSPCRSCAGQVSDFRYRFDSCSLRPLAHPANSRVLRSKFGYLETAKMRRNGSVSRSNCWLRSHRPRTTLGESME